MVTPWREKTSTATLGREGLEEHGREADGEHHDEVVGPGDVGEGKSDGPHVLFGQLHRHGQASTTGHEGGVGVAHAFGVRRRARGVVDPPDLVVARRRGRGKGGGVALGQRVVGNHHGRRGLETGTDLLGHGDEVEALPHAGHEEELGSGLGQGEGDLALAVDVDDGVLNRTEAGQSHREHDRLDPAWVAATTPGSRARCPGRGVPPPPLRNGRGIRRR